MGISVLIISSYPHLPILNRSYCSPLDISLSATITTPHPPSTRSFLARTASDCPLELQESTADLISDRGTALLMMDWDRSGSHGSVMMMLFATATTKKTSATGGSRDSSGCGERGVVV